MAAATSTGQSYDDGYPPSSEADLDPGADVTQSLENADHEAGGEQRVAPGGRGPDGSIEDDDPFADA